MNHLDDLLEAVEETSIAAADYRISEADIARLGAQTRCLAGRDGWVLAGMQRAILGIAAQHHAVCALDGCRTCASIRYGLTSTLAMLRVLVAEERVDPAERRTRLLRRPRLIA